MNLPPDHVPAWVDKPANKRLEASIDNKFTTGSPFTEEEIAYLTRLRRAMTKKFEKHK